MKKLTFSVLAFLLCLTLSAPSSAATKGSPAARAEIGSDCHYTKDIVFRVTPDQFRKAMGIFQKKYPDYRCDGWSYNYDNQHYAVSCQEKEVSINVAYLYLTMDGYVKVKVSKGSSIYADGPIGQWE